MKLSDFKQMKINHQVLAFAGGLPVGRYVDCHTIMECRQIDDFYVECKIQMGEEFKCFIFCHRNTAMLDKYFQKLPPISLEELGC